MTSDQPQERFTLTLDAKPDGVPAAIRLRRLLKYALRALNLRAVEIREGAAAASAAEVVRLRKRVEELTARQTPSGDPGP